jgi:hypothetical protein
LVLGFIFLAVFETAFALDVFLGDFLTLAERFIFDFAAIADWFKVPI